MPGKTHTDTLSASEARQRLAEQVSERTLQDTIVRLAKVFGFLAYHTYDSRRSAPGFPDLVLCHPERGETLFMELKTQKGKVRKEQRQWLDALQAAGQRAYLIRPLDMDRVEAILRGEA